MILGRELTARERRRSQRLYCAFNFVNGMSYMCLGESLLVLFFWLVSRAVDWAPAMGTASL